MGDFPPDFCFYVFLGTGYMELLGEEMKEMIEWIESVKHHNIFYKESAKRILEQ